MELNTTEELIEDIRQGKMVILMDDEDRENEGDIIIAAEKVRPEDINFMATHARGLICLTLTQEHCKRLNLPLMVQNNGAAFSTNFTLSIEAAEGVTTGHLRRGSRPYRAHRGTAGCETGRYSAARPHLSGDGAARWRAEPGRAHRSRL